MMQPYGQALHACGTTRIGSDPATSVVNPYSQLHECTNVFIGGNSVISTANSVNPTLTSMVFARKGAEKMIDEGWGESLLTRARL
jgi:choline dehydrogenase-like flavoprotein